MKLTIFFFYNYYVFLLEQFNNLSIFTPDILEFNLWNYVFTISTSSWIIFFPLQYLLILCNSNYKLINYYLFIYICSFIPFFIFVDNLLFATFFIIIYISGLFMIILITYGFTSINSSRRFYVTSYYFFFFLYFLYFTFFAQQAFSALLLFFKVHLPFPANSSVAI